MDIKLDQEQMQAVVAKALFDGMTAETRDGILQEAIKHLLTPEKPAYGRGEPTSPILDAMKTAAFTVANQIARDKLANDPAFQAELQRLFADVTTKLFESPVREKLISQMCDGIINGMKPEGY